MSSSFRRAMAAETTLPLASYTVNALLSASAASSVRPDPGPPSALDLDVQPVQRRLHVDRRSDRPEGVVLMDLGNAEHRHHGVAVNFSTVPPWRSITALISVK
jgi:hypothetical protein